MAERKVVTKRNAEPHELPGSMSEKQMRAGQEARKQGKTLEMPKDLKLKKDGESQ